MATSRLDFQSAVDRYGWIPNRGFMFWFPNLPGVTSNATTGVPTNGIVGAAPGAFFFNTKASAVPYAYINEGTVSSATWVPIETAASNAPVIGVAAGYKLARGQTTTASASDTVVTGLGLVVSVTACLDDAPVVGCSWASASKGDQAGTPAAGSILVQTWKPTTAGAGGNPDVIAATTFSKKVNWIAVGTA